MKRVAGRIDDLCDAAAMVADKLNRLTGGVADAVFGEPGDVAVQVGDGLQAVGLTVAILQAVFGGQRVEARIDTL